MTATIPKRPIPDTTPQSQTVTANAIPERKQLIGFIVLIVVCLSMLISTFWPRAHHCEQIPQIMTSEVTE